MEFNHSTRLVNDVEADVLLLAGDILIGDKMHKDHYQGFLADLASKFPRIYAVAGNHEFYGGYFNKTLPKLKEEYAKHGITFLNDEVVDLGDVTLFGGTLWTNLNKGCPLTNWSVGQYMNDYQAITYDDKVVNIYRKLRPVDTKNRHSITLEALKKEAEKGKPMVVMTHHAPSFRSVPAKFQDDFEMNGGYASDLSDFMCYNPNIKVWVHGHMHEPVDYMVCETRVLANPKGYPNETYTEAFPFKLKTFDV